MRMTLAERLEQKIDRTPGGCWLWLSYKNRLGYGSVSMPGRPVAAHRVVYELYRGPIPEGLVLDHLCRNPSCVNPDHLEPVTDRVNILRSTCESARNALKTHCPHGHPYSPENTRLKGDGSRVCRTCDLARKKVKYNARYPANKDKTHCPKGHEYTQKNTGRDRGKRYCKTCHRERERKRYARAYLDYLEDNFPAVC